MYRTIAHRPSALMSQPASETEITTYRIAALGLGALLLAIVLSQIPDMLRYLRMSRM